MTHVGLGDSSAPVGFVGDALADAFGVGTHAEAFHRLQETFGTSSPQEAFAELEATFGVGATSAFGRLVQKTAEAVTKAAPTPAPKPTRPSKHFVLARSSDCWKGASLRKVPASSMALPGQPFSTAKYWSGGRSKPLPAEVEPHDMVTVCWEDKGTNPLNAIGKGVESAVKSVGKAAVAPVEATAQVAEKAAKETTKAVASAAKFVAKTGGDAAKFLAKQAKDFANDPMGSLAKIASSGGLSLIGVDPQKALEAAGIPTPDTMLKELGLPTTEQITHVAFKSVTNPKELLDRIPGLNQLTQYIPAMPDPTQMAGRLVNAAMEGDLEGIKREALAIGHQVSDIAAMVPGVGNVIGGPLASAITLLETGSALKAALSLLLNEVPGIPPQIRDIIRTALNAIADIVEGSKSVTDVLLVEFKNGVREQAAKVGLTGPIADLVESVLDGAIQIIFQGKPLDSAALDVAERGLEIAKDKVTQGIGSIEEVQQAQSALSDLRGVYKDINTVHALTQGVVQLAKQDPTGKNPGVQKRINDLRASMEGAKLTAQGRGKKAAAASKKKPPRLSAPKQKPPTLRAKTPSPTMSAKERAELEALSKLSPEERRRLAALSPEQRAQLRRQAAAKGTAPAPVAPGAPYGPYPHNVRGGSPGGVSGPPHGPHGHHPHGPFPHFRGSPFSQAVYAGRQLWQPWWTPPGIVRTETCRTWGPKIELSHPLQIAAKTALGASGGQPTTVRGPDGVLYLFAYEGGLVTARPCAAVATT